MNEFLQKVKSLDKRILIGAGVAIAVVVIVVIALVTGGSDKLSEGGNTQSNTENSSQMGTEFETEAGTELETELGTELLGTELGTELETELGTELETEVTESEDISNSENTSNNGDASNNGDTSNSETQAPVTNADGELVSGPGSAGEPHLATLGNDLKVTTVSIPANTKVYYNIYRVGGMYMKINDADAFVIYNGTRYDAKNGAVSLKVGSALASDAVSFVIGNKSGAAKSFTISFSNPTGSHENPTKIDSLINNSYNVKLAAGNEIGHYHVYKAEQTGVIRFYITAITSGVEGEISVTNNRTSANRTFEADAKTDETGQQYIEMEVTAGDEVMILVSAKPDRRFKYPAADITFLGVYY